MRYEGSITDIRGLRVGHASDFDSRTGCTVVLTPKGAIGGVCVRGAAPGTRETDLLRPDALVEKVHAVVLSGGSAFGLAATDGVMDWCRQNHIGLDVGVTVVPIVPAAVLFDLAVGKAEVYPNAAFGWQACEMASESPVVQGQIGAGTGCTVGKVKGMSSCMPGGIGSASLTLPSGVTVAALVAVNALGDIYDYSKNERITGIQGSDSLAILLNGERSVSLTGTNTTIGIVATNARLTKTQANRLAEVAHDGFALSIRPVHTMNDGDTLFALSYGDRDEDMTTLCTAATEVVARAIVNAVTAEKEEK